MNYFTYFFPSSLHKINKNRKGDSEVDSKHSNNTFDFIVVGTGPAGAVIAKTLTDDKKNLSLSPRGRRKQ